MSSALSVTWSPNATSVTQPSIATYAASIGQLNFPLPWAVSHEEIGTIRDATGRLVAVVDPERTLSDIKAYELSLRVIQAVNTCGGFDLDPITEGR